MKLLVFFSGMIALSSSASALLKKPSKTKLHQHVVQDLSTRQASFTLPADSSTAASPPSTTQYTVPMAISIGNSSSRLTPSSLYTTSVFPEATSNSTSLAAAFTGSPTMAPNMNGYINYETVERPKEHVDTLQDSWGIASTSRVEAVRFRHFCKQSPSARGLCNALHAHVAMCANPASLSAAAQPGGSDSAGACDARYSTALLRQTLAAQPCASVYVSRSDALTQKVCATWLLEAGRCARKTVRGPCAGPHVLYLLKQFWGRVGGEADAGSKLGKRDRGVGAETGISEVVLEWRKKEEWRM
jgi:hypothetical protein